MCIWCILELRYTADPGRVRVRANLRLELGLGLGLGLGVGRLRVRVRPRVRAAHQMRRACWLFEMPQVGYMGVQHAITNPWVIRTYITITYITRSSLRLRLALGLGLGLKLWLGLGSGWTQPCSTMCMDWLHSSRPYPVHLTYSPTLLSLAAAKPMPIDL